MIFHKDVRLIKFINIITLDYICNIKTRINRHLNSFNISKQMLRLVVIQGFNLPNNMVVTTKGKFKFNGNYL
jgi:hypothetical protein